MHIYLVQKIIFKTITSNAEEMSLWNLENFVLKVSKRKKLFQEAKCIASSKSEVYNKKKTSGKICLDNEANCFLSSICNLS